MSIDWFGLKAIAAKKIEIARQKKEIEEVAEESKKVRLEKIKAEFQILKKRANEEADKQNETDKWWCSTLNDKCPKCGSKHVNERIKRIQGQFDSYIDGDFDGGFLRGTSGSIHGEGHGKLDTNEVNKCNDCQHEWKVRKRDWIYESKRLESNFDYLCWLLEDYHKAFHAKFNPEDLKETFTSADEKRTAMILEVDKGGRLKTVQTFFRDISIETIKEVAAKEIWPPFWSKDKASKDFDRFMEHFKDKYLCGKIGLTHIK
jgi:ribosomal protein S27AE